MFSTKKRLIERTGYNNIGRYDYLKLLATEFKTTKSREAKKQTLANLANFAYDPINYDYIRELRILDLFLHILSEPDKILVRYAIGGICNLCLDPLNKAYILRNQGRQLILPLIFSNDEESVLSALTTLMFLITNSSKASIVTPDLINRLTELSNSSNKRIKNLVTIFVTDYCDKPESTLQNTEESSSTDTSEIVS
ncbi:armadillo repeat-containing protein 7-like [Chelonus insularis]|uniref:armadillo repeat-containing protein 7-like n=1 Tax=Chelonus insularis TaxID=460826 RepID=UPI00158EDBFF|nr:armadillo repeat-containing protein 7-like [Chelonus insularis]